MLGGGLDISVLATSWIVIDGAIDSSVELTPPLWKNRHRLCIYVKETGHIPPASNPATMFSVLLMIPFSNPIDAIAMAFFYKTGTGIFGHELLNLVLQFRLEYFEH